jgi:hypothetical protein
MATDIKDVSVKLHNSKYFALQLYKATNIADY